MLARSDCSVVNRVTHVWEGDEGSDRAAPHMVKVG